VIVVPNSELIASAVTNWTYRDRTVRMIIKISVAYGSPTRRVSDLLMKCAKDHADVLTYPAPQVLFRGFGDWALNFELRCFVGDTDKLSIVRSDLCFAIDDSFRANGIEIPLPQRVLHVRANASEVPEDGAGRASAVVMEPVSAGTPVSRAPGVL
jgi:small-conductance mechanosensitive channel